MHNTYTGKLAESGSLFSRSRTSIASLIPGGFEIWATLLGAVSTVAAASFFNSWGHSEVLLLTSAISFTAALVWVYAILLAGTGRRALIRLGLATTMIALAASVNPDMLAASFVLHAVAAAHAASETNDLEDKLALLAWTGSSLTLTVLTLVGAVQ
jgi:hypothetical protein